MAAARVRMVPVTGVSLVVQLVGGGLSALTNLYLARHLGPGNQGALQVLVTVPAIVIVMGNLGVHVAGAWFVARERYEANAVLTALLWWALLLTAVLVIPTWLLREQIRTVVFGGLDARLVWLSLGCLPFYMLSYYVADVLIASNRLAVYAVLRLMPLVVYGLFAVLLVGLRRLELLGATLAFVTGIIATGVFALVVVLVVTRGRLWPDRSVMRGAVERGGTIHVGTVAQFLAFRLDILLVNALLGTAAAGLYGVAASLSQLVWYIGRSVESGILPRIARASGDEAPDISATALRMTAVASALAAAAIGTVSYPLFHRLLPEFVNALTALWILLPAAVLSSMSMVAASDLRGRGRAGVVAVVNLGALALNVTLNLLLLPTMGFVGAAVAALVTSVMQSVVLTQVVIAATGVTYRRILEPTARDLQMLRAIGQQLW